MSRKCSPGEDAKDGTKTGQKTGQAKATTLNPDNVEAGQKQDQKPEPTEEPAEAGGAESPEQQDAGGAL